MRERVSISEARKRFSSLLKNVQREPDVIYEITVNDIVVGELRAPERSGYRVGTRPAPDDPVWDLAGAVDSGRGDLAERHDHYLYGWDKGTTK